MVFFYYGKARLFCLDWFLLDENRGNLACNLQLQGEEIGAHSELPETDIIEATSRMTSNCHPGNSCGNSECKHGNTPIRLRYRCLDCQTILHPPALGCSEMDEEEDGIIFCLQGEGCRMKMGAKPCVVSTADMTSVSCVTPATAQKSPQVASLETDFYPSLIDLTKIQESQTSSQNYGVELSYKLVLLYKVSFKVPQVPGKYFEPLESEPRYLDTPHPTWVGAVEENVWNGTKKENGFWILFHQIKDEDLPPQDRYRCNCCGKKVGVSINFSGPLLERHFYHKHRGLYDLLVGTFGWSGNEALSKGKGEDGPTAYSVPQGERLSKQTSIEAYSRRGAIQKARQECLHYMSLFIVDCSIPWYIVEKPAFRNMLRTFAMHGKNAPISQEYKQLHNPYSKAVLQGRNKSEGFSAVTIQMHTVQIAAAVTRRHLDLMAGNNVWGTDDHWTAPDGESMSGKAFQWIDSRTTELRYADMDFSVHSGPNEGKKLADNYAHKLKTAWKMDTEKKKYILPEGKLYCAGAVTDTESKMNAFLNRLEDVHNMEGLYCTIHVLQLSAVKVFDAKFVEDNTARMSDNDDNGIELDIGEGTTINVGKGLLGKIRRLVIFVRSSPMRLHMLEEACNATPGVTYKKLILDVKTRWWSTYDMLVVFFEMKKAFKVMDARGELIGSSDNSSTRTRMLSEVEWDVIPAITFILADWKHCQLMLEPKLKVTASLVPFCVKVLAGSVDYNIALFRNDPESNEELQDKIPALPRMADSILEFLEKMRDDMEERWGDLEDGLYMEMKVRRGDRYRQQGIHPSFVLAHALDPRFKKLSLFTGKVRERIWKDIEKEMVKVAHQLRASGINLPEENQHVNQEEVSIVPPPRKKSKSAIVAMYAAGFKENGLVPANTQTDGERDHTAELCKAELESYKMRQDGLDIYADADETILSDPLPWWNERKKTYPHLYHLAVYYLSIPASSAMSESIFSSGGSMHTWNSKPENFEMKVMVKRGIHLA